MLEPETVHEQPWQRQRLRVPREDGKLLARPSLPAAVESARRNQDSLESATTDIQGHTLATLRRWSREEVVGAAREYTSGLVDESIPPECGVRNGECGVRSADSGQDSRQSSIVNRQSSPRAATTEDLMFVAGHQPSLFHPGVWVKNFAVSELAARTNGLSLNLVVDNDTFSTTGVRVPQGDRGRPQIETVPFDADRPTQPWEDASILDPQQFRMFGDSLARAMASWNVVPLATELWPDAVAHMASSARLGDCLTAARVRQERRWGVANLELPISRLCTLEPFLWFAGHLLAHLPRFREVHNNVMVEYRRVNKVRSRTHPVPDLSETDGWLEAPFWVWRKGDCRRSHLFAKQVAREVLLSDGTDVFARLPLSPETDAGHAVDALRELPAADIRLRTRALTTTLFARLCLADLFVHGIGGAKYDEMTDRIIARFFRLPPPEFMTLSATLHLPLAEPFNVHQSDQTRLTTLLRDFTHNSDRHLPHDSRFQIPGILKSPGISSPRIESLVAEKRQLIAEQHAAACTGLTRRERRARQRTNHGRFRRFQQINGRLAEFNTDQRRHVEDELADVRRQLAANAVLQDREFSFCLHPADKLQPFMTGLWAKS